jgi:hypothetical protein
MRTNEGASRAHGDPAKGRDAMPPAVAILTWRPDKTPCHSPDSKALFIFATPNGGRFYRSSRSRQFVMSFDDAPASIATEAGVNARQGTKFRYGPLPEWFDVLMFSPPRAG